MRVILAMLLALLVWFTIRQPEPVRADANDLYDSMTRDLFRPVDCRVLPQPKPRVYAPWEAHPRDRPDHRTIA